MFILDPDFYPSRIPDPTTAATKEEGGKLFCPTFFKATNIKNLFQIQDPGVKKAKLSESSLNKFHHYSLI
jgi:hypothetical protein